ncbi:phosphodiester glycosidase family protein [Aquimarina sp. AU119]|uniref:phosphodiester glycosidase family protein n=1 Tax=Aquimarina sp. AU119 TaxID=2108528 RepID=UPI000D68684B|nr:phosphodiester glycosidase family protein [Aquimarina sp. AU119]
MNIVKNRYYIVTFILGFTYTLFSQQNSNHIQWQKIDEGLFLSEYLAPKKSILGDHKITILKINPSRYDFNLFSAKKKEEHTRTAKEWGNQKKQIAIINAGMYRMDHATNLGYMKDYNFINNPNENKDNTIVAFNRKDNSVPEFQIIDRTCQNWEVLKNKYNSFTQSIRMVDCNQKNRWSRQSKKWSMVVIGKDEEGNALFIISRSPYTVHDFINILLQAPLKLYNLMYLEGGPEASFYLNHNNTVVEKMGSYETGFNENDKNTVFWEIPNVIGITKKEN